MVSQAQRAQLEKKMHLLTNKTSMSQKVKNKLSLVVT